jgi:hypothetical protein
MVRHRNRLTEPTGGETVYGPTKVGWRVSEWAPAVGLSRSETYNLLAANVIASVKSGKARIITTSPSEYLASLANEAA